MKPIELQKDIYMKNFIEMALSQTNEENLTFLNDKIKEYLKDSFNTIANHVKLDGIDWISFNTIYLDFSQKFNFGNRDEINNSSTQFLGECNKIFLSHLFSKHITLYIPNSLNEISSNLFFVSTNSI